MPKKLKKYLELTIPLYGVTFMCFPTREAETKFLGYEDMNDDFAAHVCINKSSEGISYVSMAFRTLDDYCTETLAHESVHAAWRILELVGVISTVDNQEPLAYLTGWVANKVNMFMMGHVEANNE
jgi:hypothetical protein